MIIGGTSAGGKTSSLRTGYSERFFPCKAYVANSAIETVFNQTTRKPITYSATIRIRNVADTAWVTLTTCTYFQITRGSEGNIDTADITIAVGTTWSAYKSGGEYEDLLLPSNRQCQIIVNVIANGTTYSAYCFSGRILRYSENIGARSYSINIGLQDVRSQMLKTQAPAVGYEQTNYRSVIRNLRVFSSATGSGNSTSTRCLVALPDVVLTTADVRTGTVLDAVESSIPSQQNTNFTGAGVAFFGIQSTQQSQYFFEYTDANIISVTRTASDLERFNSVIIAYGEYGTFGTVTDDEDIAKNGEIVRNGIVGYWGMSIADATLIALELIEISLRGTLTLEIPLNQFLEPGSVIKLSSTKYSIPEYYGRIISLTHQYRARRAVTYINELKVSPI